MHVLKQGVGVVGLMALGLFSQVFALSFVQGTIFLDATSEADCEDQGGNYMEWNEEIYCTMAAEDVLTAEQKVKVSQGGARLLQLIDGDQELYDTVVQMLWDFSSKFATQGDIKRQAIAGILIQYMQSNWNPVPIIPKSCTVWFDGCNTCQVGEDGLLACTKMACVVQSEPMCKVHEKIIIVADHTIECEGVGPMSCLLIQEASTRSAEYMKLGDIQGETQSNALYIKIGDIKGEAQEAAYIKIGDIKGESQRSAEYIKLGDIKGESQRSAIYIKIGDIKGEAKEAAYIKIGDIKGESQSRADSDGWTYFYSDIEGFDYIEGYEWTLLVEEKHVDPANLPADASSITWKLKEIISITAEIPETCSSWYDGCNTCMVGENGVGACTLMYCEEMLLPYCMDEGVDNAKATDYNSSRSNRTTS